MIDRAQLKKRLSYNKSTGLFKYRVDHRKRRKGDVAGVLGSDGYVRVFYGVKPYAAHRLAWFYVTGKWPKYEIDHKNRNRSDNRWKNLREATRSQNKANSILSVPPQSGYKGVRRENMAGTPWLAYIRKHGKTYRLGLFATPEMAHAAHIEAAKRLHGEFARVR